jgi:hypothetical protein
VATPYATSTSSRPARPNAAWRLEHALSLVLLVREDAPLRYERAAVRWVALLLGRDRTITIADLRELADLLAGVGRHDQVATLRLERWLRVRGLDEEADRVA